MSNKKCGENDCIYCSGGDYCIIPDLLKLKTSKTKQYDKYTVVVINLYLKSIDDASEHIIQSSKDLTKYKLNMCNVCKQYFARYTLNDELASKIIPRVEKICKHSWLLICHNCLLKFMSYYNKESMMLDKQEWLTVYDTIYYKDEIKLCNKQKKFVVNDNVIYYPQCNDKLTTENIYNISSSYHEYIMRQILLSDGHVIDLIVNYWKFIIRGYLPGIYIHDYEEAYPYLQELIGVYELIDIIYCYLYITTFPTPLLRR